MKNVPAFHITSDKYRMIYLEVEFVGDLVLDAFMKWADKRRGSDRYVGPTVMKGRFTGTESDAGLTGTWAWDGGSYTVINSVIQSPPDDGPSDGSKRSRA